VAWSQFNKPQLRAVLVLALTGLVAGVVAVLYSEGSADFSGQDQQPVAFSHARHAGDLGIACLYCHRAAPVSSAAGVPSMNTCMGCHRNVAKQSADLQALQASWERQQPIEWTRLHRLPDFVYFTHAMHLRSGMNCTTCHGHVEETTGTPRAASLEMGWCVSCHEARGASRDCWTCHK
jgi:hypothetical protein